MTAQLRLRLALERAAGSRVVVAREDIEALIPDLAGTAAAEHRLCCSLPAPGPTQQVSRGRRVVALATTTADAKRLAAAAWDSDPNRVAEHGRQEDADPVLTWHTVRAAERTLRLLAAAHPTSLTEEAR